MGSITIEEFKKQFRKEGEYYMYLGNEPNAFRHFGFRENKVLYFTEDEIAFMHSRVPPETASLATKAYFELKNADKNIIANERGGIPKVYEKTANFRRETGVPIGSFYYVNRDDKVVIPAEPVIVSVMGDHSYCFIKLSLVETLSHETDETMIK